MHRLLAGLLLYATANFSAATSLIDMVHAEDLRRICAVNATSNNARVIRRDVKFIAEAAKIAPSAIQLRICENPGYASVATTLDTLILAPEIAELPTNERFFVLAHEIGHLANLDALRWGSLEKDGAPLTEDAVRDASRRMELDADKWAATSLQGLHIDPLKAATAFFFRRGVLDLSGTVSHPSARARLAAMTAAIAITAPLLSP